MTAEYLLPCSSCGRKITIKPCQAGETLVCSCGASIQAPTFLEITRLEPAPTQGLDAKKSQAWGGKQGLQLLGCVLASLALLGGVYHFTMKRPVSRFDLMNPEKIRTDAQRLTPVQTWETWSRIKQGLDQRMDEKYLQKLQEFYMAQLFIGIVILVGAILFAIGKFGDGRMQKKHSSELLAS